MRVLSKSNKSNNITRKQSWDIIPVACPKSPQQKKRTRNNLSTIQLENIKAKPKSKKDLEVINKPQLPYYSAAQLNIINILNTCINEDLINDLSFNSKSKKKNSDNKMNFKNKKYKNFQTTYTNFNVDTLVKRFKRFKSLKSSKKLRYLSSLDVKSINPIVKTSIKKKVINDRELKKNKTLNKRNVRKSKRFNRRSLDLNCYNKKMTMNFKNRYRYNASNLKHNSITNPGHLNKISLLTRNEGKESFIGDISDIDIVKMNKNIVNDINLIHLRKRISQLKRTLQWKYSDDLAKSNNLIVEKPNIDENVKTTIESEKNYVSNKIKRGSIIGIKKYTNKYRKISRKVNLFDSFDDDEYLHEEKDFFIPPNSLSIKILDFIIFISSLIYFIIIPYCLSHKNFISRKNDLFKIILIFIDIIYIIEMITHFFRPYKNFDENYVKKTRKIITHYLKSWFLIDLIQAFPYFSLFHFLENHYNYENPKLYILLMIKAIKLYRIHEDNNTISYLYELGSRNEIIDDNINTIELIFIFLSFLNISTCLYIFLGINSYQSWIIKLNMQDEPYYILYLTSLYFVIVTITTVGYGDITGNTIGEIFFQIILVLLGTIAYSLIISYFSNYVVKINQKSLNFENKVNILNEIKLSHPNMKQTLYQEVLRNLHNEQFYEKKDKQLLFQCLPYSLKNKLIMEMYRPIIKNFIFFKEIDNSDFIVKVATSLKPLISIKGEILVQEGEFVKEIFFIKKGMIGLNICIDANNPETSINKYLNLINDQNSGIKALFAKKKEKENEKKLINSNIDSFLSIKKDDSNYSESDEHLIENINIIEIRNREHFGDALMFLNERSPINAIITTRSAEMLILKKVEAIEIYSVYPYIWKRINKKSLYNMEQIYLKIKKTLIELSYRYNVQISKKNIKLPRIIINKKKNNKSFLSSDNSNNKSSGLMKNKFRKHFQTTVNEEKKEKKDKKNKKNKKNKKENNEEDTTKNSKKSRIKISKISKNSDINEENNNCNKKNNTEQNNIPPIITYNYVDKDPIKDDAEVSFNRNRKKSINSLFSKDINSNMLCKSSNDININNNFYLMNSLSFSKTNNSKNSDNDEFFKNREINNEIYENENFNIDMHKKYIIYPEASSINKNYIKESFEEKNFSSINDSNNMSSIRKKLSSKVLISNHEKIFPNTFINLCSTKENSIQLNSSYENINKISNYRYIKNSYLQKSTKKFIIDECSRKSLSPMKNNTILRYQKTVINPKIKMNDEHHKLIKNCLSYKMNNTYINKVYKSSNSLRRITKDRNEFDCNANNNNNKNGNVPQSKKPTSIIRASSHKNETKEKYLNMFSPGKVKRKIFKKKTLIGKKLNAISKNIQNANEAINNPNEFYMNFFNNILQKESIVNNKEEDGIKTKKTVRYINNITATICNDKKIMNKSKKIDTKLYEKIT